MQLGQTTDWGGVFTQAVSTLPKLAEQYAGYRLQSAAIKAGAAPPTAAPVYVPQAPAPASTVPVGAILAGGGLLLVAFLLLGNSRRRR